ncbi:MAG: GNAT family N-acetyltransferase [Anaerolineales bacterium]|nr:GNAT family N-acetyltransferase [Anaerolineales bacterium]
MRDASIIRHYRGGYKLCYNFPMLLPLQTDRLVLRDFVEGDFEAFHATTNDPEYGQFYAVRETTRSFWWEVFARIRAGISAEPRLVYQLAITLPAGDLIGTCGVRSEDAENGQASFGCAIARPYWGHGYAYEASRAILDAGFSTLRLHRIYAETISENARARALAERLGMRLEGELRERKFFRDRWWHIAIYAVLAHEWAEGRE